MTTEVEAKGWKAIDRALAPIYGDQEPKHWGTIISSLLGGRDPLQGISAYRSTFGGTPHWHFVTYGFSELYEKESRNPEVSGWGVELTCRVVDREAGDEPPKWVLSLLQNLARYVFATGNVFEPKHSTTLNGPIVLEQKTELVGALFARDPELAPIDTPNGRVEFVQLMGITEDEYAAIGEWDVEKLTKLFATKTPALLTDVQRASYLRDPELAEAVRAGAQRDGSSKGLQFAFQTRVDVEKKFFLFDKGFVFVIGANEVLGIQQLVRGRLRFEREATVVSKAGGVIRLVAAAESSLTRNEEQATLALSAADQAIVMNIPVKRGDYPLPSGKGVVRVVPTEIRSEDGTTVLRVVG